MEDRSLYEIYSVLFDAHAESLTKREKIALSLLNATGQDAIFGTEVASHAERAFKAADIFIAESEKQPGQVHFCLSQRQAFLLYDFLGFPAESQEEFCEQIGDKEHHLKELRDIFDKISHSLYGEERQKPERKSNDK